MPYQIGGWQTYVVEYTYMPTDFITGITEDVVKSSIYSYLENDLGLKIQSAHRIARADMPTEQEKKWLDIGDQVLPVLEVEQVAYLDDGRILSTLFPVTGQIDLNLKV